jgi:hypothetical protein
MWTMQEIVLAKDAVILCGDASVPWHSFGKALDSLLAIKMTYNNPLFQDRVSPSIFKHIAGFQVQWDLSTSLKAPEERSVTSEARMRSAEKQRLLMRVLSNARNLQCQDSRDKICALYGMLTELCSRFPAPNYAKSPETMYHEATMAVLKTSGSSLWILSLVNGSHRSPDLPSWVPDWSDPDPFWLPDSDEFCASGKPKHRPSSPVISSNGRELRLSGTVISKVQWASEESELPPTKPSVLTLTTELQDASAFLKLLCNGELNSQGKVIRWGAGPEALYTALLEQVDDPRQYYYLPEHDSKSDLNDSRTKQPDTKSKRSSSKRGVGQPAVHPLDRSWLYMEHNPDQKRDRYKDGEWSSITWNWNLDKKKRSLLKVLLSLGGISTKQTKAKPRSQKHRGPEMQHLSGTKDTTSYSDSKEKAPIDRQAANYFAKFPMPSSSVRDARWKHALGSRRFQIIMFLLLSRYHGENDFKFRLYDELRRCAFFLTRSGRLGTAFHTARKGDLVVLFEGANRPMLVRPVGERRYTLVGPAYVHGIMEGQAWPNGEVQLDTFTLV